MKTRIAACFILALGIVQLRALGPPPPPGSDPSVDPTGDAGALKTRVETGCGYDPHGGSASRSTIDLHAPAVGAYGLDFVRHWNSTTGGRFWAPNSFGRGGWSHSWEWIATWDTEDYTPDEAADPRYSGWTFTTNKITVNFPDGRTEEFYYQCNDHDDPCGPPHPANWASHPAVADHLAGMDPDGNQFWLYLADGGSVHFVAGVQSSYVADKVYDPHGLITQLLYDQTTGLLSQVIEPAGRSLDISWKYVAGWPFPVIDKVQSGAGDGFQQVAYNYDWAPSATGLALYSVTYVGDKDPDNPQTDIHATYDYFGFVSPEPGTDNKASGPMLQYADDPRFAGAMTRIRYKLQGMVGLVCSKVQPVPAGQTKNEWVIPSPYAIMEEQSGYTSAPYAVSRIEIPCGAQTGTPGVRREYRGAGGSRMFFFGAPAGEEPAPRPNDAGQPPSFAGGVSHLGYQLKKLTDFAGDPGVAPFDFQNYQFEYPRRLFDGRGILTEVIMQPFPGSPFQQPDGSGRVAEVRHLGADGTTHYYNWSNPGASAPRDTTRIPNTYNHWLFSQTDERGKTTTYTRDSLRRVTRIDYDDGSSETFADYNVFNQYQTHTLPSGAIEHFEYDGRGLLQREWNSVDGESAAKIYSYQASDPDRVWRVQDGIARAHGKDYSAQMEYNKRGQVIATHYPSTPGGSSDPVVLSRYDAYGNRVEVTNELGQTTKYKYDPYRRCLEREEPLNAPNWNGAGSQTSRKWNWYYDRWDDATQTLLDASTHTSKQWRVQVEPAYNAAGDRRLSAKKYDYNDRVIEEASGLIEAADGSWQAGPDTEVHQFDYDANGNKQVYRDPLTRVTTYTYDNRNRLKQMIEPKRTDQSVNPTTSNEYDATGNKTRVTFPNNTTQQWPDYNAFGQPRHFIDERGNVTDLNYWQWGPMKKLAQVVTYREKDGSGTENQPTGLYYDLMGRPQTTVFPDSTSEISLYELGLVKTWQTRRGQIKTITYDARAREISHSWSDGTPGVARTWDDAGRLTSLSNIFSSIDYGYDASGQVMWEGNEIAGSGGRTQTNYYRYPSGEVAHLHYPGGVYVRRDYTARGQLAATGWDDDGNNWWMKLAAYTYLPDGKVDHVDYGNGMTSALGYDDRGIASSVQHKRTGTGEVISSHSYTRDTRDRITSLRKGYNPGSNPLENGRGDRFHYDDEGQLLEGWYNAADPANSGGGNTRYDGFSYDALGNRGQSNYVASRGLTSFFRRDNGLNQYSSWSPSVIYHDDNYPGWNAPGNGVMMTEGWVTASYNALNQPIAIWSPNMPAGAFTWFGYDPLGRCVKRWVSDSGDVYSNPATYFQYDGWNLLQEGTDAWGSGASLCPWQSNG